MHLLRGKWCNRSKSVGPLRVQIPMELLQVLLLKRSCAHGPSEEREWILAALPKQGEWLLAQGWKLSKVEKKKSLPRLKKGRLVGLKKGPLGLKKSLLALKKSFPGLTKVFRLKKAFQGKQAWRKIWWEQRAWGGQRYMALRGARSSGRALHGQLDSKMLVGVYRNDTWRGFW